MELWIAQTFKDLGPDGFPIIFQSTYEIDTFDAANASAVFGAITAPPTYAALSALACAAPDAGNWQRIFDDWKSRGLVS